MPSRVLPVRCRLRPWLRCWRGESSSANIRKTARRDAALRTSAPSSRIRVGAVLHFLRRDAAGRFGRTARARCLRAIRFPCCARENQDSNCGREFGSSSHRRNRILARSAILGCRELQPQGPTCRTARWRNRPLHEAPRWLASLSFSEFNARRRCRERGRGRCAMPVISTQRAGAHTVEPA